MRNLPQLLCFHSNSLASSMEHILSPTNGIQICQKFIVIYQPNRKVMLKEKNELINLREKLTDGIEQNLSVRKNLNLPQIF